MPLPPRTRVRDLGRAGVIGGDLVGWVALPEHQPTRVELEHETGMPVRVPDPVPADGLDWVVVWWPPAEPPADGSLGGVFERHLVSDLEVVVSDGPA